MKYHFGVIYDKYSPNVETALVRDLIKLQNFRVKLDLVCCTTDRVLDRVLDGMNIPRSPLLNLAGLWLSYSTTGEHVAPPEYANVVVTRDLNPGHATLRISDKSRPGYFLPDLSMPAPPRRVQRPSPNGYAIIDPAQLIFYNY